jgi:hypothetical protein
MTTARKTKIVPVMIMAISVVEGLLEVVEIEFVELEVIEGTGAGTGASEALAAEGVKVKAVVALGAAVLFTFC